MFEDETCLREKQSRVGHARGAGGRAASKWRSQSRPSFESGLAKGKAKRHEGFGVKIIPGRGASPRGGPQVGEAWTQKGQRGRAVCVRPREEEGRPER